MEHSGAIGHPPTASSPTEKMENPTGPPSTGQRTSCDSCKRSKLKCKKEEGEAKCTRCIAKGTECTVTTTTRKKREKKTHYLTAIEDRMKRMESAMNASGISIDDPIEPAIPAVSAQSASLEDKLSIFMINDDGVSGFVGPSSGFSLFSPQGLRWISDRTGTRDFENIIRDVAHSCDAVVFPNTFLPASETDLEPLPPKDLANQYIETYFQTFNCTIPLYNKETVMARFAKDYYNVSRHSDPAWYASLNIIFLIGRGVARVDNGRDLVCERYFINASSVSTELLFNSPSLLAVQAMIGMAFVMQAGEDPHPSYILVGIASRLAQAIGLHRRLDGYGLTKRDIEQRRNVFWIALGLEKGISIRYGRPSVFSDDDIGVELPPKDPNGNLNLDRLDSNLDLFRATATLALLESRVYSKLYSARSHTKSELERLKWVGALDTELLQWRDELPILIRPENPIKCHEKHLMHVIMMHFAYYNCLVSIHRGSVHHGSWINTKKPDTIRDAKSAGLNPRVFESGAICLQAARQVIGLLNHYDTGGTPSKTPPSGKLTIDHSTPPRMTTLPSMCNYYPLAASLTLFANILANPLSPTAIPDIALMHCVTSILSKSFSAALNPRSSIHERIFKEILGVAIRFVAKARGEDPAVYKDLGKPRQTGGLAHPGISNIRSPTWDGTSFLIHPLGRNLRMGNPEDSVKLEDVSASTSASHSGNESETGTESTNMATTPASAVDGSSRFNGCFNSYMPVDTPSPGPPPYIPSTSLNQQQIINGITPQTGNVSGTRTPMSQGWAAEKNELRNHTIQNAAHALATSKIGSGANSPVYIATPHPSFQNTPILPSNAPPFLAPQLQPQQPQQTQNRNQMQQGLQPMEPFDFNSYNWDNAGVNVDDQQLGAPEGMMGFGMEGQNSEEGEEFLPMVFQWDLADIWNQGSGSGMGM